MQLASSAGSDRCTRIFSASGFADAAARNAPLRTPDIVTAETLAVFDEFDAAIDFIAHGDTSFVLGSAIKHPHDLVTGYYSVHQRQRARARRSRDPAHR
jgi:hypothetical protein